MNHFYSSKFSALWVGKTSLLGSTKKLLIPTVFLIFLTLPTMAQGPGSLFVDAGPDVTIDCDGTNGCADITASFLSTYETSSSVYTVESIPYNPPFAFNGLANPLNPNIDDAWSDVDTLPFDFCYFGNLEQQFQVGSNGVIRFDVDPNDTSNGWSFTEDLPNNSNPTLGEANVFTPGHDIDPSVSNTEEIGYEVLGTYPNRVLVVSYFEVPMFSGTCNSLLATQMVVFYEFSNVIEIYIQDKPSCPSWNDGNAALGIQNNDGNIAYVPPGRNTSDSPWTTTNEAWRFTPAGAETFSFEWVDAGGTVIGTTATINVCPDGSEVYTARVTYTNECNGDTVVLQDDVTVTSVASYSVDLGADQQLCDQADYEITAAIGGADPADATFLWSTGETTQSITVSQSNTYSVEVEIDDCIVNRDVTIEFGEDPLIELGDTITTCFEEVALLDASPSNFDPALATYQWSLNGNVLPAETSPTLLVSDFGDYSVVVTFGFCNSVDTVSVVPNEIEMSLGEDIETCFDEALILDASPSNYDPALATYEWSMNGTILPSETSPTLEVLEEGVYSVVVSIGICTAEDSVVVSPREDLVVSLGEDFKTCANEVRTISAATEETDVTYQWLVNGDTLPDETGSSIDISFASNTTGSQTVTVIISSGNCTGEDSVDISLYNIGQCLISEGLSPNGDGMNDCLDLEFISDRSGSFSLEVFNRYGASVFNQSDYLNQWCGQDKDAADLPTGTYFYVIKFSNPDVEFGDLKTGWIYLNRESN
ncbi:gliding motility-associated-like protein [Ulvibacter sp. MAR_2010_11]|uniref:gliding motility-associated C-terminal domain-containing protein n=1 Tax=Ulvibacter sp. MAR_2010_11 TaxID=1250229 RepID=UPI000CAD957D|nr:gliding motility-associated C-terminal domain-containing protein [Ulvibacter sp. MAR_2010_11]PKA82784.1 gliding motility-associated-like protein [Ulvibacter sp. MAR_2010_11]